MKTERYWVAILKNGQIVREGEKKWDEIENDVCTVGLSNGEQMITLPKGLSQYGQAKTVSADLMGQKIEIESRYISAKIGNNIVKIRVDEKTNNISLSVE